MITDFSQICAQAIFSALDHLTHWTFRQIRKSVLAAKNRKDKDDRKSCRRLYGERIASR